MVRVIITLAFFARLSACRHALEPNLRRCILAWFRVLCCAVQGNHLATFAPTELRSLLIEPRFDRTARKISRLAKTVHLVSVQSDLNDAVCSRSGASANTDDDADNDSEGPKNFHGVSISLAKKSIESASEVEGEQKSLSYFLARS